MPIQRELTQLYPNVWRLVAPNPSQMTGPGTNTYLVGHEQVIIIDPGPYNAKHMDNIFSAVQTLQAEVYAILITHVHTDHAGYATQLASELKVPLLRFNHPLQHGDEFMVGDIRLRVYHTPGHIYAHICPFVIEQQILFAGDLVAGEGTVVIIPPDGDMSDYIGSLRAMHALAPAVILPGHGPAITNPQALLQEYIDHRLARELEVLKWFSEGYTTAESIAAQIYADRPEVLGVATLQTEAHLIKLRKEGRL